MKKLMSLQLTTEEMEVLESLSKEKDISKTAVLRQALRIYQLIHVRTSQGAKFFFEDDKKEKAELMLL